MVWTGHIARIES